jgi:fumarate reductase flavoprotein subunit
MTRSILNTDIAVVGAGGCGMTAAIMVAELGQRVILLESDNKPGGSTAMSASLIVAAGSRLQQANGEEGTPDELAADILLLNNNQSDSAVTHTLCHVSGQLMDWLQDRGVPLEHIPSYRYAGMSHDWLHGSHQRNGDEMTSALLDVIQKRPEIELHLSTAATGLISDAGSVTGIAAKKPDGSSVTIKARSVILASSGFGADPTKVSEFIADMAAATYFGAPYAGGEAIDWGREMGAALDHMGAYQSHSSIAFPNAMLVTTYLINHGAIQVNRNGERFSDETDAYAGHALAIQRQPGDSVVEIFDERIKHQTLKNYPRFSQCLSAGIVFQAETVADLAKVFDLDRSNLAETLSRYNSSVLSGVDEFGRTRFGEPLSPPFYGIRVTSALVQTLGGLRVDERARVLKPDGSHIPGLFAGGGTAAGLAGERPEGYLAGAGLLSAFGLGWIAGREAANIH